MSRTISADLVRDVTAQDSDEVAIVLLSFSAPDLATPIRISSDPTVRLSDDPLSYGTRSRGQVFLFLPIDVVLPDDTEDGSARARLSVDDIAGPDETGATVRVSDVIRANSIGVTVTIEVVRASAPDLVEASFPDLHMSRVTIDNGTVGLEFVGDVYDTESYPADSLTPGVAPTLF